jgi:prepilin-type N-terminal cleavage/methylation domain-containing protein|tara:strand:+ start:1003 stop:1668 length:666 start_codon:yes stop_codon:yes gene_type:complete
MNLCKKKNKNFDAFSLIELIVVVVLIGIVSGIGLPSIAAWNNERETQSDATRLSTFFNSAYNASQQGTFEYLLIEINPTTQTISATGSLPINNQLLTNDTRADFVTNCTSSATNNAVPATSIWDTNILPNLTLTLTNSFFNLATTRTVCLSKGGGRFINNLQSATGECANGFANCLTICHSNIAVNNACPTRVANTTLYQIQFSRYGSAQMLRWNTEWTLR